MAAVHLLLTYFLERFLKVKSSSFPPADAATWEHVPACRLPEGEGAGQQQQTTELVIDFDGILTRTESSSSSLFPFFFLVAFEGGGLLRALLFLLVHPILMGLRPFGDAELRLMSFVVFFGLQVKDMAVVARAVLPKFFYMQSLDSEALDLISAKCGEKKVVAITRMPRVMVEGFLRDHLMVDEVVAPELQLANGGKLFNGLIYGLGGIAVKREALSNDRREDEGNQTTARERCPRKPIIFHDGRLAFLPTPFVALAFFLFLPAGIVLGVIRIFSGLIFPYNILYPVIAATGLRFRVSGAGGEREGAKGGAFYVCNHKTLLDPIMVGAALQRSVPAVTYSLSRISEMLSPIKLMRLSRDRDRDAATMTAMLAKGDLVVCPEGTTCREPYLLRFSPLFAELSDELVPVALDAKVTMFQGTTATGLKSLDSVLFMMNPWPEYNVQLLGRTPPTTTRAGGLSAADVANRIQRRIADALGFECTMLTRKDKYMTLAGTTGAVAVKPCHH